MGSNYQPVVRGRTTIGSGFMIWLCIGVMGQVLHPIIIFRGGGEVEEYEVDPKRPGRPKKIIQHDAVELAVLYQNVPSELEEAAMQEEAAAQQDPLEEEDLQVIQAALLAENELIEQQLPADLPRAHLHKYG